MELVCRPIAVAQRNAVFADGIGLPAHRGAVHAAGAAVHTHRAGAGGRGTAAGGNRHAACTAGGGAGTCRRGAIAGGRGHAVAGGFQHAAGGLHIGRQGIELPLVDRVGGRLAVADVDDAARGRTAAAIAATDRHRVGFVGARARPQCHRIGTGRTSIGTQCHAVDRALAHERVVAHRHRIFADGIHLTTDAGAVDAGGRGIHTDHTGTDCISAAAATQRQGVVGKRRCALAQRAGIDAVGIGIPADGSGVVRRGPGTGTECRCARAGGPCRDEPEERAAADGHALIASGFAEFANGDRAGTGGQRNGTDGSAVIARRDRAIAQCRRQAAGRFAVATEGSATDIGRGTAETRSDGLIVGRHRFAAQCSGVGRNRLRAGTIRRGADLAGQRVTADRTAVFAHRLGIVTQRCRAGAASQCAHAYGCGVVHHCLRTRTQCGGAGTGGIGTLACRQRVFALDVGTCIAIGAAAGLEVFARGCTGFGNGVELIQVHRIGALRAGRHVGDLTLVAGTAHRHREVAIGHRVGAQGHAAFAGGLGEIAQRRAVETRCPCRAAHCGGVIAGGFGRQQAEQGTTNRHAVVAAGHTALARGDAVGTRGGGITTHGHRVRTAGGAEVTQRGAVETAGAGIST